MTNLQPTILFRSGGLQDELEVEAAKSAGFNLIRLRTEAAKGDLVLPRYSAWPFYADLYGDLVNVGATPIVTPAQQRAVSSIYNWYHEFEDVTPRTYLHARLSDLSEQDGPFIVKGEVNSRKHKWSDLMFAPTVTRAREIAVDLMDDSLFENQRIVVRQYEPLQTFDTGMHGLPITNEWRCWLIGGHLIHTSYYWSSHPDAEAKAADSQLDAEAFVRELSPRIGRLSPLAVADVARRADGRWRLIELNCGMHSGINSADPAALYTALMLGVTAQFETTTAEAFNEFGVYK